MCATTSGLGDRLPARDRQRLVLPGPRRVRRAGEDVAGHGADRGEHPLVAHLPAQVGQEVSRVDSPPMGLACLDGVVGDSADARIAVTDEGLLRGDGVFEVVRLYGGAPFALDDHLDRMGARRRTCACRSTSTRCAATSTRCWPRPATRATRRSGSS
jgi:hypothetical protein